MSDDAVKRAFQRGGFTFKEEALVSRCTELCQQHALGIQAMLTKYEVFQLNKSGMSTVITAAGLDGFKAFLEKSQNKENHKVRAGNLPRGPLARQSWEDLPDTPEPTPKRRATDNNSHVKATPGDAEQAATPAAFAPGSSSKFSERANSGQVVASLGGGLVAEAARGGAGPCALQPLGAPLPQPFRFMTETISTKVAALEQRIVAFAAAFERATGASASASVGAITLDPVIVTGRIVSDSEGPLNDQSVLLEGGQAFSQGARVKLDLSQLPAFRLFPGQLVAVKGMNPCAHTFIAQHIWAHLPPPPAAAAAAAAAAPAASSSAASRPPLSAVVACGPFSTSGDLSYEPLEELLNYCTAKQPDLLLLVGPFVDEEHPQVAGGLLEVPFSALFEQQVLGKLRAWQQAHGQATRVALQPALRDAHHLPVFPQPAFPLPGDDDAATGKAAALLQSVPNPCVLELGGGAATLAVASHDVLRHLSGCEISRQPAGAPPPDRMAALASHLVGQRCMYPLYPPPLGACLDTTFDAALALPCTPSILLTPSDLAPFAKALPLEQYTAQLEAAVAAAPAAAEATAGAAAAEGGAAPAEAEAAAAAAPAAAAVTPASAGAAPAAVVCINPGRLVKGATGGTFAHIVVQGGQADGIKVEVRRV